MKPDPEKQDHKEFSIPGLFITFEGGEGAGKTTLINKIADALAAKGFSVVKTREPGGSKLGDQIRQWLLNTDFQATVGQRAELMLFLAARAQHLEEKILPALKEGKIVLCDRFNDSTIAYQGVARGLGEEEVHQLCDLVCQGLTPDLTLFLDVNPKIGLERTRRATKENAQTGNLDRIEAEELEFHEHVHRAFKSIASQNPERVYPIDANGTEEEVYEAAWEAVEARLQ